MAGPEEEHQEARDAPLKTTFEEGFHHCLVDSWSINGILMVMEFVTVKHLVLIMFQGKWMDFHIYVTYLCYHDLLCYYAIVPEGLDMMI